MWYDCDDLRVSPLEGDVVTKASYVLFYRRRNHKPDNLEQIVREAQVSFEKELESRRSAMQMSGSLHQSSAFLSAVSSTSPPGSIPSTAVTVNNSRESSVLDQKYDISSIETNHAVNNISLSHSSMNDENPPSYDSVVRADRWSEDDNLHFNAGGNENEWSEPLEDEKAWPGPKY
jgi:hypothetical protein